MTVRNFARSPWSTAALCWLAISAILLVVNAGPIGKFQFPDPDDTMRLVQVRDLLGGQGWFDLHQYRLSAPHSPVMHWSRLVDAPLALAIGLLTPLVGQAPAELATAVAMPLLTLGVVLALVARLTLRLCGREPLPYACLALCLSPLLVWQVQPLRIDHHGWQIAAFTAALAAAFGDRPWRGGAMAGASLAIGLTISLELLPQTVLVAILFYSRWWRDPDQRGWLGGMMAALPVLLAILAFATRTPRDLVGYCDVVAMPHLAFFAIAGAGTVMAAAMPRLGRARSTAVLALSGAIGAAVFSASAPQCLAGPFGNLDPLVRAYWYDSVFEGLPIWRQDETPAVAALLAALVAVFAGIALWREADGQMRTARLEYLFVLVGALLAGLMVWRSMAFVAAVSALPLGWLTWRLMVRFRHDRRPARKALVAVVLVVALMPAAPASLLVLARPAHATAGPVGPVGPVRRSSCDLASNAERLNRLPRGTLFAPIDVSPVILARTRHAVVATGHHRAQAGMRDLILAFTSPPDAARAIVKSRHASYLVVCRDLLEPQIYARRAPDGLMARILAGKPPPWLEPLDLDLPPSLLLYKVR